MRVPIVLGPGLAKTRKPRLVVRLVREIHRVTPAGLDELFAHADIMSEGAGHDALDPHNVDSHSGGSVEIGEGGWGWGRRA